LGQITFIDNISLVIGFISYRPSIHTYVGRVHRSSVDF